MVRAMLSLLIVGAIMLVAAGIVAAIGADVTQDIQNTQTAGTVSHSAAGNATSGIGNLAAQMPNIGTVLGAAAIIAIIFGVLGFFAFRGGGRGGRGE
jgi:hypothetical protein